jgi:hypothetical protein
MGPAPNLVLAMGLHRRGDQDEARRKLALAVFDFDWRVAKAGVCEKWIYHALPQETEAPLVPDLPGFLAGPYRPTDPAERRALVGVCQATDRTHALARLYAEIFADCPKLAEDLRSGRRYNAACSVADLAEGDPSGYHRVLSLAQWSALSLAAILTRFIVQHFWPRGRIRVVGDDTVAEHPGKKVYGKARHREPVRSSHSYTAWRWGHRWVVLAVLVRFPFAQRPWALPVLVTLYRSKEDNLKRRRPHRTPAQLMQLLRVLLRWFPDRQFVFAGDQGYGSHEMARLAGGSRGKLRLVSKFYPDANLYEPPPEYKGKGRPRVKGAKLPTPQEVVAKAGRVRLNVAWYGGGRRDVEVVSGTGHWYKAGAEVARHLLPLVVIAAVTLTAASWLFRRRME